MGGGGWPGYGPALLVAGLLGSGCPTKDDDTDTDDSDILDTDTDDTDAAVEPTATNRAKGSILQGRRSRVDRE